MTDFNREIFRVVCERLMENRSVELIALSEQLSEEQMGKVAGIMADPVSSRATPKEAQDYIEVILAGKKKKNAGVTSAAGPPAAGTVCGRFGGKEEVPLLYCGTQPAKRQRVLCAGFTTGYTRAFDRQRFPVWDMLSASFAGRTGEKFFARRNGRAIIWQHRTKNRSSKI